MKKRKIYIVTDIEEPQYQMIFGSKTNLLESFFESECESYIENLEYIIGNRDEKCHNCKKDIDTIQSKFSCYNDFICCISCNLFYCVHCVKRCSKCNEKLISRDEAGEKFKNKITENFEKDGIKSLENYDFKCIVEEEEIEFSDDE
jgi:hypothetical protein